MKNTTFFKNLIVLFVFLIATELIDAQVLITPNSSDTPDGSAMLQINSTDGGVLIPRLDRTDITAPADGLLIYDIIDEAFYLRAGGAWVNLSSNAGLWTKNGSYVYLSQSTNYVGVGTSAPTGKFVIKGDGITDVDSVLFEVRDNDDNPIFQVTSSGVRIYVKDETAEKAVSGGFAVGRYGSAKGFPDTTYFSVTPYQTEVNTKTPVGKAVSGGFAVGRYGSAKGVSTPIFTTTPQETRVYTTEPTGGKAVSGGFAVGRYGSAKGPTDQYMHITKENYFIGHSTGAATTPGTDPEGRYNIFLGYESGLNNTIGYINTFIGHNTGRSNIEGNRNVFLGTGSGYTNQYGNYNLFAGYRSGYRNLGIQGDNNSGTRNVFLGFEAGYENVNGSDNVMIGYNSGHENTSAGNNICIGTGSGKNNQVNSDNIFIGLQAGFYHIGTGVANEAINNIYIGKHAGYADETNVGKGNENIFIGTNSGYLNQTGNSNVFIGVASAYNNSSGKNNIILGDSAGFTNSSGYRNIFIGQLAGYSNGSSWNNICIGDSAGYSNTVENNVFIGTSAGLNTSTGKYNVFIGEGAGYYNTDKSGNVFLGTLAGAKHQAGNNVMIGNGAGYDLTANIKTGGKNIYLGNFTGAFNGDSSNIFIGHKAGYGNLGGHNIFIGEDTWSTIGDSSILIGTGLRPVLESVLIIDDGEDSNRPLIYGRLKGDRVGINTNAPEGDLHVVGSDVLGRLIVAPEESTSGDDAEICLAEDKDYTYGMSMKYDGGDNRLYFWGKSGSTYYGPHMTIGHTNGYVGINTGITAPLGRLDINHDSGTDPTLNLEEIYANDGARIRFSNSVETNHYWTVYGRADNTDTDSQFNIYYSNFGNIITATGAGEVGIGTSVPTETLDVNGNARFRSVPSGLTSDGLRITSTGRLTRATSDRRLKENIKPLENVLDKVLKLNGVNYTWKSDTSHVVKIGFIAQDMREVFPEFVFTNPTDGYLGINYSEITAVLSKAIQEQQEIIESQKTENDKQNSEIEQLKIQIQELKELIQSK